MSNNKQSSVEWLISQLQRSKDWHRVLNEISQMSSARVDIIEQAKAMHKEEIVKAYNQSWHLRDKPYETADKYYNETFGGNNEQQ
jgi:alkylated DNA nucleotide flippase Atl1